MYEKKKVGAQYFLKILYRAQIAFRHNKHIALVLRCRERKTKRLNIARHQAILKTSLKLYRGAAMVY